MHLKRTLSLLVALTAVTAVCLTATARAENTAPAITAFDKAFAGVNDYTCKLHSHEALGTRTQDRVYLYSFMKPHFAKTLIESGDGAGSGGVWTGGTQVSGHQGGILSGLHLKVDLHDPRAVSLRGYTIPDGLLSTLVERYAKTAGTLTQVPGGKIGGVLTDRLELKVANPAANDGITDMVLYLSQESHMPVRQILYAGSQIVLDQTISDLKTNVGLTANDFPF
jgi:outer membrane lipoprotein-sorting protein